MAGEKAKPMPVTELVEQEGQTILDDLLSSGIRATEEPARERGQALIKNLVEQLLDPTMVTAKGVTRTINERISAIDDLISGQVNAIMHSAEFQKIEGTWRGLHQFVMSSETGESLKIRVMNAKKEELLKDFQAASEFTESALWKKIYEYEFGLFGGDPFGALIGDFEFGKGPRDVELLSSIAQVAAAAHAPFLSATAPSMFGMDSFTQMPDPRDLAKIFDKSNPENIKWISFRDSEDSRFVGLTMPHVLGRQPYDPENNPADSFNFVEQVDGTDHDRYLWINAAYSMAGRLTDAFAKHHWCVAIRGVEGGGLVEGLPIHTFQTREGDVGSKCPTEVLIPDTRENELAELGFIPLLNCKNTDYAAFFGANSVQKPKKYDTAEATANAKLSSQLQYLMCTSRIAHYLKAICRDKVGSFMSRQNCQDFLNRWINNYVLAQDDASQEAKAKKPLREAQVQVEEIPGAPGSYRAVAHIRPHFQLEAIDVSLRLVADLPAAAK